MNLLVLALGILRVEFLVVPSRCPPPFDAFDADLQRSVQEEEASIWPRMPDDGCRERAVRTHAGGQEAFADDVTVLVSFDRHLACLNLSSDSVEASADVCVFSDEKHRVIPFRHDYLDADWLAELVTNVRMTVPLHERLRNGRLSGTAGPTKVAEKLHVRVRFLPDSSDRPDAIRR